MFSEKGKRCIFFKGRHAEEEGKEEGEACIQEKYLKIKNLPKGELVSAFFKISMRGRKRI